MKSPVHTRQRDSSPSTVCIASGGNLPVSRRTVVSMVAFIFLVCTIPFPVLSEVFPPQDDGIDLDIVQGDLIFTTDGMWDIESGDTVEYSNMIIQTTDSLAIRSGGILNLTNVTLYMGSNTTAKPVIDVLSNGELNLVNCTVAPAKGTYATGSGYAFRYRGGARGSIVNSVVYGASTSSGNTVGGLLLQSSNVLINGSGFNSSITGITTISCSPDIINSDFYDNTIGLSIYATSATLQMPVKDCRIYNNTLGIYTIGATDALFESTTVNNNNEGVRCINTNFLTRYPIFSACTVRENDKVGINMTNSRCFITNSDISQSVTGIMAERCIYPVYTSINGSTISDCDTGLLLRDSQTITTSSSIDRCKVYMHGEDDAIIDLDDVYMSGGIVADSVAISLNSSRADIEGCTIGPVERTFVSIDSFLFGKNSTIAIPGSLFLDLNNSNCTLLNTDTHTNKLAMDNSSFVIEGGFHDVYTVNKDNSPMSWQSFQVESRLYDRLAISDFYGHTEVMLHHKKLLQGGADTSYGRNTFTVMYRERENVHVVDVYEGLDIYLEMNYPPEAENLKIVPVSPRTNDTLIAQWTEIDLDKNDTMEDMRLKWFRDGKNVEELENTTMVNFTKTRKWEEWSFSLMLYDGLFWSDNFTSTRVMIGNTPPHIDEIEDIQIHQGEKTSIPLNVSDTDGDQLDIVLVSDVVGASLNENDTMILFKPSFDLVGEFPIEVQVSDGTTTVKTSFSVNTTPIPATGEINLILADTAGPLTDVNISTWETVEPLSADAHGIPVIRTNGSEMNFTVYAGGVVTFTIWKEGYWAIDHEISVDGGENSEHTVILEKIPTSDFRLGVTDTTKKPVIKATVSLKLISLEPPSYSWPSNANDTLWQLYYGHQGDYETDGNGSISIPGLYQGEYLITVEKDGYERHQALLNVDSTGTHAFSLYRVGEKTMKYVKGTVVTPSGDIVKNIEIEFESKDTFETAETDTEGNYQIRLPKGTYAVRIYEGDYRYIGEVMVGSDEVVVLDIPLERVEKDKGDKDEKFVIGLSIFLAACIIVLLWALFFITFHKKKELKTAEEIIAAEEEKRILEKEKKDAKYRKKIYSMLDKENPLESLAKIGAELEKLEKQKKDMAILDEMVKGRYVKQSEDFVHTGYGAVFQEYMKDDEIEFIDEDVEWGKRGDVDDDELLDTDDDMQATGGGKQKRDDAFEWAK